MSSHNDNQPRNYTLIYPVYNLKISRDIGGEIQIERVIFVSREKIPWIRKRIGLKHTISELNKIWSKHRLPKLFEQAPSFAIIKFKSRPKDPIIDPVNKVKEGLWILTSSQFFTGRNSLRYFGLPEHQANITTEYTLIDNKIKSPIRNFKRLSPSFPYELDKSWKHHMKNHFFLYLLKILDGKSDVRINSQWKNSIRNAAIFAGKSHFSKELSSAFLYNFIAIDNLLSNPGEKYPNCLIDRLNALFGWLTHEKLEAWKPAIKRLYELRNKMVHYGDTRHIRTEDLILSDNIVYNILYNICRFINHFPKKQSLIDLSIRVNARRILGQKVREMQNFRYSRISMPSSTISKIKKENNWP